MTYAALLRGVNVGGNHKLPMKDLAALIEGLGGRRVRTYIQSGNAVFDAPAALAARLPQVLAAALRKRAGFEAPVVVRSAAQLQAILDANPYVAHGVDPQRLHVGFLAAPPAAAALAALDPRRSPGDACAVVGQEIYLHLPQGVARTRLTNAYFDNTLATICTVRNWRTVQALAAMARE